MEKLCLRCGAKFSDDIDLLSGDFAATGLDRYQKTTEKTDRISWKGLRNYYGAKG